MADSVGRGTLGRALLNVHSYREGFVFLNASELLACACMFCVFCIQQDGMVLSYLDFLCCITRRYLYSSSSCGVVLGQRSLYLANIG